ncbi:MAG: hypothetical protein D6798_10045, partial [Deltaproteobacteria bacterium]
MVDVLASIRRLGRSRRPVPPATTVRTPRLVVLVPLLAACSSKWDFVDQDGDGISAAEGDCWDRADGPPGSGLSGADIHPGAAETWYDGFDQDCSGDNDYDQDGDGYVPSRFADDSGGLPGGDCDDTLDTVHPGADAEWYDGFDSDCAGNDDYDQDGDGYVPDEYVGLTTEYVADSGNLPGNDCDDTLDTVHPGAEDEWYDGVDSDCAGNDDYDQDGDGYVPRKYAGLETQYVEGSGNLEVGDCDDTDPNAYPQPDAPVVWYNGVDERCDENDGDQDGDGYWIVDYEDRVALAGGTPLPIPEGLEGDCFDDDTTENDQRPDETDQTNVWVSLDPYDNLGPEEVYPGAEDRAYDGVDADCAGDTDFDKDGDGQASDCLPDRYGNLGTDCRDSDDLEDCGDDDPAGLGAALIYQGALDTWYDGTDADCGDNDDYDADFDNYASEAYSATYTGSLPATDCDDNEPDVNPSRVDVWYDGVDTDCDDRDDYDADEDGYVPDAYVGLTTTYAEGSGSLPGNDCDDTDSAINPSATEIWYDGVDQDCDDHNDYDADYDGERSETYGGTDCDDADATINTAATEIWYDGVDQDCDDHSDYDADF